MARPKSYDRQNAVEKACRAFWAHGYQALGVRELERLTGLNQFAIRTEFGGKEGLYLEALKFYSEAAIATAMAPLKDGGLAEITSFLQGLVAEGSSMSSEFGCLIVNTGIENARIGSARLDEAVKFYWQTLEDSFLQALVNAQDRGEICLEMDIDSTAGGLTSAVMGVHAHNRLEGSCGGGRDLVALMCNHLEGQKVR